MLESNKYVQVNIGGRAESVYIRIKKDIPMPEPDKAKLTAGNEKAYPSHGEKRLLQPNKEE